MDPIVVPEVPKSAFNRNRPASDLIRSQVDHFKHIEKKLSSGERRKLRAELRGKLPKGAIKTEGDAARYIGAMTRLLRSRATATKPALLTMPSQAQAESGLAMAAAADSASGESESGSPSDETRAKE